MTAKQREFLTALVADGEWRKVSAVVPEPQRYWGVAKTLDQRGLLESRVVGGSGGTREYRATKDGEGAAAVLLRMSVLEEMQGLA